MRAFIKRTILRAIARMLARQRYYRALSIIVTLCAASVQRARYAAPRYMRLYAPRDHAR